jgi:uncharacterized DUF497 family protein
VKRYVWDTAKNKWLQANRSVSFEHVVLAVTAGDLLDAITHPNREKYPHQKMFIVKIRNYAYLVPFVETEHEIFLKTIIPSRKATQIYLKGEGT